MPTSSAPTTSARLLSLLSLLQARRDWPGGVLAARLEVSERTVRRDVDRLRELGYPIEAVKGPDGGYRLDAGARMPPLLFDDDQAVALAVALRAAVGLGVGIEEAALRALHTVRQVLPARLRHRVDGLDVTVAAPAGSAPVDPEVLLAVGAAIRAREELRFDYRRPWDTDESARVRRTQPHHLVVRGGRWYLLGWDPVREDWRTYRADRMAPRTPTGPRFPPRDVPGGDVAAFVSGRLKGSGGADAWPCQGRVVVDLPAARVAPFAPDAVVEALGADRCRVTMGSWSWVGLAATLLRLDADVTVESPAELREAFDVLAARAARAS